MSFVESEVIEESKETTAPVMRRQKTAYSNSSERSVRRISYLRATANDDISLQESVKVEESVEELKDEKTKLSDELQMLAKYFKQ